jgi:hypothetical protein
VLLCVCRYLAENLKVLAGVWTPDGQILAGQVVMRTTIWRFRPDGSGEHRTKVLLHVCGSQEVAFGAQRPCGSVREGSAKKSIGLIPIKPRYRIGTRLTTVRAAGNFKFRRKAVSS